MYLPRLLGWILIGTSTWWASAPPMSVADAPQYAMPRTEVRHLRSGKVDQDYALYVSLPRHYTDSTKRYPLVLTLDADYAFGISRNVVDHFVDRARLPEMIVVSIAYPGASEDMDLYHRTRTRDYTPTHSLEGAYSPEIGKLSGGGPAFLNFITTELFPFLERTYRIDPTDRTFVGHSFGGLFGAWVLVTRPATFRRYILVSPSLWYDGRMVFGMERDSAPTRGTPPVDLFLGVGGRETARMPNDLLAFAAALRAERWPQLNVTTTVFPDDDHDSVFPAALTRGLQVTFHRN